MPHLDIIASLILLFCGVIASFGSFYGNTKVIRPPILVLGRIAAIGITVWALVSFILFFL
jgi:hypothetical protein